MRLTYFGIDSFASVLTRILEDGHEVQRIYSCRTDNNWSFNRDIRAIARAHRIPISFRRARAEELARSNTLLLSACYPHRIAVPPSVRGINLHPTLLPEGRGPWPQPHLLRSSPQYAGLTLHKLTPAFDAGDILAQRPIAVGDDDDLDTLEAKLRLAAPDLVSATLEDVDRAWEQARPQGSGSYWKAPGMAERMVRGERTVEENLRVVRAFSSFEARVQFGAERYCVSSASGWREWHNREPGTVVLRHGHDAVMAVRDGYLVLRRPRPDRDQPTLRQVVGRARREMRRLLHAKLSPPRL